MVHYFSDSIRIYFYKRDLFMSNKLLVEIIDHTALLTINNPHANTWDPENLTALTQTIDELNNNKNVYALVLTGQGDKFFSAGADLNMFSDGDKGKARNISSIFGKAFDALSNFRGVTIAALNGYTMGGGLEAALACDIRIAEEQILLALPEAKIGLLPCGGGTQRLLSLTGEGWAKRIILCGERINAAKAKEIGLVEEVVAKGQAKNSALHLASQAAQQSPSSVAACKSLIQESRSIWEKGLLLEREYFAGLFDTQDQKEGVSAFLEKRKPQWKNA
jgi:enoyl-CoA hydratase/carnithine racemase